MKDKVFGSAGKCQAAPLSGTFNKIFSQEIISLACISEPCIVCFMSLSTTLAGDDYFFVVLCSVEII